MARILVIDDNESLRETVREILTEAGYEVVEASDGREGIALCQAHPIDLLLTDLLMPGQEGLETTRELRRMEACPKIIAMSGGGQTGRLEFLDVARVLGADRTLHKPVRARDLLRAIRELLGEG